MDIGFCDTIAVGGARYCLVFVDRATRYNWVFPLKTLSSSDIVDAFNLFRAQAGRFATCFRCDCDDKLLGQTMKAYLTKPENNSDIVGRRRRPPVLQLVGREPLESHGSHVPRVSH